MCENVWLSLVRVSHMTQTEDKGTRSLQMCAGFEMNNAKVAAMNAKVAATE